MPHPASPPRPALIQALDAGMGPARILAVATQLGLFPRLACAAWASVRRIRILLDALVGLRLFTKTPEVALVVGVKP
jgi:hypothetical protein